MEWHEPIIDTVVKFVPNQTLYMVNVCGSSTTGYDKMAAIKCNKRTIAYRILIKKAVDWLANFSAMSFITLHYRIPLYRSAYIPL